MVSVTFAEDAPGSRQVPVGDTTFGFGDAYRGTSANSGYINPIPHKGDASVPSARGFCDVNAVALVIDGGDTDSEPQDIGHQDDGIADSLARDANAVADWLRSNDYNVQRISQYWKNDYPAIKRNDGQSLENRFLALLERYGDRFEVCCEECECTMEFFLYIAAHGSELSWDLYDPSGSGTQTGVNYTNFVGNMKEVLDGYPECVRFTIMVDACQSGGASGLAGLGEDREGTVLITTTDDDHSATSGERTVFVDWLGGPVTDSGTQDFMEGGETLEEKIDSMLEQSDRGASVEREGDTDGHPLNE